jgi:DNA-directed RNA polymerase specialized sigma24 family protein
MEHANIEAAVEGPSEGSVTGWVDGLRDGDPAAARKLWGRYFGRLVGLARRRLRGTPRRGADEEDVALSAFDSFRRGAERGRFPDLGDRDDLWRLLVVITARKAGRLARYESRLKRGGGASQDPEQEVGGLVGREPSPEFAAQVAEECQQLLGLLGDGELRRVALWKMEGWTNEEIAGRLGCVPRTVERKLRLIRALWDGEAA